MQNYLSGVKKEKGREFTSGVFKCDSGGVEDETMK